MMMSVTEDNKERKSLGSWPVLLFLALVSLAVFGRALGNDFLINWDDRQYVLENAIIRGVTMDHLKNAFSMFYLGNYAPLHLISYMVDFQLWGLKPFGFILANIFIHTLNGLLFYLLLSRLAGSKAWTIPAAVIFLVHPLQVESVAWISQRKNLLAMFFFFIAIYLYRVYLERKGEDSLKYYLFSIVAFVLALLCKSVVVILPLVLILMDLCLAERRGVKSLLLDKVPFIVLGAVFAMVAVQSQSMQFQGGRTSWHGGSPYSTLLTMLPVIATYLRMIIWPSGLSAFYDTPIRVTMDWQVAVSALLVVALAVFGFYLYRRRRDLFFWYALFFICLVPVLQIVPIVTLMNDRYLYFPMMGAAPFFTMALFGDTEAKDFFRTSRAKVATLVMLTSSLCFATASFQRTAVWRNSATLWGDAVEKAPNLPMTHVSYGEGLLALGRLDEANGQFEIALQLDSSRRSATEDAAELNARANILNNLGTVYGIKGNIDKAVELFDASIRLNPGFAKAYYNLGNGLMQKGMFSEALGCFESAARLEPENPRFSDKLVKTRELLGSGSR